MVSRPPPLLFPDVEAVLSDRIRAALEGRSEKFAQDVHVGNKTPNPRRDRMVIVRRDGGLDTPTFDQPRVGVNVWAVTEDDASDLAALVRALFRGFADGSPILAVTSVSGPSAVPDESKQPRFYFTAELRTRGVHL